MARQPRQRADTPAAPTDYGQTRPHRAPTATVTCVRCGGFYIDDEEGRAAHRVVFTHQPTQQEQES